MKIDTFSPPFIYPGKKLLDFYSPLLSTSSRGLPHLMFNIVGHKIHKIRIVAKKFFLGVLNFLIVGPIAKVPIGPLPPGGGGLGWGEWCHEIIMLHASPTP